MPCSFDLRSNQGGVAVSGEVTLHADRLYVQASQPTTGSDTGILFRSCDGRRDYVGGVNNFASLAPPRHVSAARASPTARCLHLLRSGRHRRGHPSTQSRLVGLSRL
jgi:hypothetical protein